jgi:hypothetical protein
MTRPQPVATALRPDRGVIYEARPGFPNGGNRDLR